MKPRQNAIPRSAIKRKPRAKAKTARIYGPPGFVDWLHTLPCCFFWAGMQYQLMKPCQGVMMACHSETGGMGYKADWTTQVPGCALHHGQFDRYEAPFGNHSVAREQIKQYAREVQRLWQSTHPEALT